MNPGARATNERPLLTTWWVGASLYSCRLSLLLLSKGRNPYEHRGVSQTTYRVRLEDDDIGRFLVSSARQNTKRVIVSWPREGFTARRNTKRPWWTVRP